jgi:hypothetical protein
MWTAALAMVAVSAVVRAQDGKMMDQPMMSNKTNMMYTGCIKSVNHDARFLLTHLVDDDHMTMGHSGMMNKDSGMAKKEEATAPDDMHKDHMMPSSLSLTGRSDLKKYAGQKVTVTGSVSKGSTGGTRSDVDTLAVRSLKVVAKRARKNCHRACQARGKPCRIRTSWCLTMRSPKTSSSWRSKSTNTTSRRPGFVMHGCS